MEKRVLEFQEMLLKVEKSLSQADVLDLVFLCTDLLKKDLSSVVTGTELFSLLQKEDLLSLDDISLLQELLTIIKQNRLLQTLSICTQPSVERISRYRRLLFELAENISEDDLKSIKFLLYQSLPRKTLDKDLTMLQLFWEMEKGDLLAADNLDTVERIIRKIAPFLLKTIHSFKVNSGDNVEGLIAHPDVPESSNQVEEPELSLPDPYPHSTLNLETYKMTGDWRGFCLIINNHDFSNSKISLKNREGTHADEKSLEAVFDWLSFKTKVVRDCDRQEILKSLQDLRSLDHTQADCVVCCVLTHGCEDGVYGVDDQKVTLRELMEPLDGHHCPALIEKPKLFFIQACRGTERQQVVFLLPNIIRNSQETDIFCDAVVPRDSIPAGADFLMAMATVPNFVSYRDKVSGSWFIQTLCENLKLHVPRGIDLLSILTQVNNDVSRKSDRAGTYKQIPQPEFTLTKRVVFPIPPDSPPPS